MEVITEDMKNVSKHFEVDLKLQKKNMRKARIDQFEIFEELEHQVQEKTSGCKGKDYTDATKLRNKITLLKSENDKLKKRPYEKDSIKKALTDTVASIDETG